MWQCVCVVRLSAIKYLDVNSSAFGVTVAHWYYLEQRTENVAEHLSRYLGWITSYHWYRRRVKTIFTLKIKVTFAMIAWCGQKDGGTGIDGIEQCSLLLALGQSHGQ